MKRRWLWIAASAIALAVAALLGCGQQSDQRSEYPIFQPAKTTQPDYAVTLETEQAPQVLATTAEVTTTLTTETPELNDNALSASKETVEKAKADLAHMLGIPENEIDLVLVIGQEFTADGFSCRSNKGMTSNEEPTVMIAGETILLRAQGSRYEYHTDGQVVTFCRKLP